MRKSLKRSIYTLLGLFILANIIAAFHAYKFTHFGGSGTEKTKDPSKLSALSKIQAVLFGVNNPRPENKSEPVQPFSTLKLKSNKEIECWSIQTDNSKGTVILCHGFSGNKATMLDKSDEFLKLGYNTLLVDFMGSGGSEGNQTTIGYFEDREVKTCYDYLVQNGEKNIYLFGTSMGAVAVMKAISQYDLKPAGIIIECPFGTMYQTVCARFHSMHVPEFPMAGLLVFWGGVENGFWAFDHNPIEYSKKIKCPTLLLAGGRDDKVSLKEIADIFANLAGRKKLKVYPNARHENFLNDYRDEWVGDIKSFLDNH